jgi:excisionase family DNA binding protein
MMRLFNATNSRKRIFTLAVSPLKSMPDLAEFMTTDEAARELGFTVQSVRNMVYKRSLQSIKWGRSLLISRNSVKEYKTKTQGLPKNSPLRKQN